MVTNGLQSQWKKSLSLLVSLAKQKHKLLFSVAATKISGDEQ